MDIVTDVVMDAVTDTVVDVAMHLVMDTVAKGVMDVVTYIGQGQPALVVNRSRHHANNQRKERVKRPNSRGLAESPSLVSPSLLPKRFYWVSVL